MAWQARLKFQECRVAGYKDFPGRGLGAEVLLTERGEFRVGRNPKP